MFIFEAGVRAGGLRSEAKGCTRSSWARSSRFFWFTRALRGMWAHAGRRPPFSGRSRLQRRIGWRGAFNRHWREAGSFPALRWNTRGCSTCTGSTARPGDAPAAPW